MGTSTSFISLEQDRPGKKQRINHDDNDDHEDTTLVRRGWQDLPQEIVELFMRRLLYIDHINVRATCKSWHSVGGLPIMSDSHEERMPWLLCINCDDVDSWSLSKLSDPTYKKVYTIDMSPLKKNIDEYRNLQAYESKSGWVLFLSRSSRSSSSSIPLQQFIMYSPFLTSNNILELPVLRSVDIMFATFSCSGNSFIYDGWTFIALSKVPGLSRVLGISTYKWGDDTWISQYVYCHFVVDDVKAWIYSQGLIYFATKFGEVGTLSVDGQGWSTLPYLPRVSYNKDFHMMRTDKGNLYLFIAYGGAVEGQWTPIFLDAYRLNISGPETATIWQHIEDLGQDRALFLDGRCKSFVKLISNTPREIADRVYYLSELMELKHSAFYMGCSISNVSFPCSKHYGQISEEIKYKKLWVEPPDIS